MYESTNTDNESTNNESTNTRNYEKAHTKHPYPDEPVCRVHGDSAFVEWRLVARTGVCLDWLDW